MNFISAFLQHEEPLIAQVWLLSASAAQVAAAVPISINNIWVSINSTNAQ